MQSSGRGRKVFSALIAVPLLLLVSCGTKRISPPEYPGMDPREALSRWYEIESIRSTFAIEFDRDGETLRGDAVLRLGPTGLDLQVYSLGFLVAEVVADGNSVRSTPPADRNRLTMLADGLRNSFAWWTVRAYELREDEDWYRIWNSWRRLFLNKRTLLPERQVIELEDGRELEVIYGEPEEISGTWFPGRIRIVLGRYAATLHLRTLSFTPQ